MCLIHSSAISNIAGITSSPTHTRPGAIAARKESTCRVSDQPRRHGLYFWPTACADALHWRGPYLLSYTSQAL